MRVDYVSIVRLAQTGIIQTFKGEEEWLFTQRRPRKCLERQRDSETSVGENGCHNCQIVKNGKFQKQHWL